ncbi:MAG: hypothetical protein IPP82_04335 [Xanthomonadales bacterium]|nr:hypothetical protein [Xanthomonadales bacterium]
MMLRAPSGQAPSAEVTDPGFDGVAADIADPLARSTLLDHEESLRREQLESMRCARGDGRIASATKLACSAGKPGSSN